MWPTAATCNMPAGCRSTSSFAIVRQGHGRSGNNRDYVLATVKAIEAEGFRDDQLHRLATMLHDSHSPPPPPTGEAQEA